MRAAHLRKMTVLAVVLSAGCAGTNEPNPLLMSPDDGGVIEQQPRPGQSEQSRDEGAPTPDAGTPDAEAPDETYDTVRGVSVTLSRTGGLCVDGPCGYGVTVAGDPDTGEAVWTNTDGGSGLVGEQAAAELFALVQGRFHELQAVPFEGTCPTAYDGSEVTLGFDQVPVGPDAHLADAVRLQSSTCEFVWPDGFLEQLRAAWNGTGAPWPL